ncbi:MAG: homing endonuclease associated repeat-containing protein [Acutalibacteraceae bacterium]
MKDKPFYYQDNRALHERKMNEAARLEISRRNIEFILEHQKDSAAELANYLRRCQVELGHVPAQSEVLGGDLLALRFGSWVNALAYSGFSVSTGPAVSNFPLERTALFQAEYERQSALHAQAKKNAKKRPRTQGANRSPRKARGKGRQSANIDFLSKNMKSIWRKEITG